MNPATLRIASALAALTLITACGPDAPSNNNDNNPPGTDAGFDGGDNNDPDGGDNNDPDGGGDNNPTNNDPGPVVNVETCGALPAAPAGALCGVEAGSADTLVIRADVLSGDTVYEGGAVVIDRSAGENGTITYAGCTPPDTSGATVLTCAGAVLSPGLLNAHDHITFNNNGAPRDTRGERFDHRHDWRTGARGHNRIRSGGGDSKTESVLYSELRHIMAGTTSIAGSGGAVGLTRNLDRANATGGLIDADVEYETFPLGDTSGTLRSGDCNYPGKDDEGVLGSSVYLPHIAEGIDPEANNEFRCLSGGGEFDLIAENTSIVHGVGLTANDIALMAQRGAKLVWSPRSNIALYGQTADVISYRRQGVPIALGTDWLLSGSVNMLRELACADYLDTVHYNDSFSDYELWRMATIDAAIALGVEGSIGDIAAGKVADLTLFAKGDEQAHGAVVRGGVETVALVLRGGQALYGADPLVSALVPAADIAKCEPVDVCGNAQRACVELDTGNDIAALLVEVPDDAYELAPCGVPADEPTCVPSRPGEYTEGVTASDADGDGIADGDDICPAIFNPTMPLSNGAQPDFDNDSDGDACDVCPTEAGVTQCSGFDPDDRDGDGVPNDTDNCPSVSNADQADGENDGIGDLCDGCPFDDDSDGTCDASIYDIKLERVAVGQTVKLSGVVVSAAGDDGLFLQVPEADRDATNGVAYSGVFVFARGNDDLPSAGDVIDVVAKVSTFSDQIQLQDIASLDVTSSGPRPTPVLETMDNLLNASDRGKELEGVLVRVDDVTVSGIDGLSSNGEFQIQDATVSGDDGIFVDDALYKQPAEDLADVTVGATYQSLVGGLSFRFGENRIEPQDAADIITGPASLEAFSQDFVFVEAGANASVTIELTSIALTDRDVTLTYSSGALTGPATVTVNQGDRSATFDVQGVTASATLQSVTATLGADSDTIDVSVYDDTTPARAAAALDPAVANATIGNVTELTVTLNAPAPAGGLTLDVTSSDAAATVPATVNVAAGATEATVPVTGAATGQATISVSAAGQGAPVTASVTVSALPAECLAISHYVEGSSNNKAVEVRNCGSASIDLGSALLCRFTNGATDSCSDVTLGNAGDMLASGEVVVLCNGSSNAGIKAVCDKESGTINHNGNDPYHLVLDDGDGDYNPTAPGADRLMDAFGANGDSSDFAKDATYARCDDAPFDGTGDFAAFLTSNYVQSAQDDITDLGSATKSNCP
jgi:cytosine/adenosine deaminase-related metal-dependent hydrolase